MHSVNLDRHLVHSVVVLSSTLVLLLILFASLIGLCTSPSVALRWWHILSLIVHCAWSIAIHKGGLLIELLATTSHLLLHSWHIDLTWRHHRLKWSHVEHWICHERRLTWSIISIHLHLWLSEWLLGEWNLPIFSRGGLRIRSATHLLMHLLKLHYVLLLDKHTDLSICSLVQLAKFTDFASISELHDILLNGQLRCLFSSFVVLNQIIKLHNTQING